jgi:hypothetical protein
MEQPDPRAEDETSEAGKQKTGPIWIPAQGTSEIEGTGFLQRK